MARMSARDDLLKPSLRDEGGEFRQIHSSSTLFACAFFGGPFAVIAMSACNSVLLRRKVDAIPLSAAFILSVALCVVLYGPGVFGLQTPDRGETWAFMRVFGVVLFGAFWWLHRRYYRGLKVSSIPPPSGILPGITFIVLGIALQVALANWFGP